MELSGETCSLTGSTLISDVLGLEVVLEASPFSTVLLSWPLLEVVLVVHMVRALVEAVVVVNVELRRMDCA